jgi:hypothetical protein
LNGFHHAELQNYHTLVPCNSKIKHHEGRQSRSEWRRRAWPKLKRAARTRSKWFRVQIFEHGATTGTQPICFILFAQRFVHVSCTDIVQTF